MIPDRIIESIIDRFSKRLQVENEIIENDSVLFLRTTLLLSGRSVYTHDLNLRPLMIAMKEFMDREDKSQ